MEEVIQTCPLHHENEHFCNVTKEKLFQILRALIAFEAEWKSYVSAWRERNQYNRIEDQVSGQSFSPSQRTIDSPTLEQQAINDGKMSQLSTISVHSSPTHSKISLTSPSIEKRPQTAPAKESPMTRQSGTQTPRLSKQQTSINTPSRSLPQPLSRSPMHSVHEKVNSTIPPQYPNQDLFGTSFKAASQQDSDYLEVIRLQFSQEMNASVHPNLLQSDRENGRRILKLEEIELISKYVNQIKNEAHYLLKNLHQISDVQRLCFLWIKILSYTQLSTKYAVPNIHVLLSPYSLEMLNNINLRYRNYSSEAALSTFISISENLMSGDLEDDINDIGPETLHSANTQDNNLSIDKNIALDFEENLPNAFDIDEIPETQYIHEDNYGTIGMHQYSSIEDSKSKSSTQRKNMKNDQKKRKLNQYTNVDRYEGQTKRKRFETEYKASSHNQSSYFEQERLRYEDYINPQVPIFVSHIQEYCHYQGINFRQIEKERDPSILQLYNHVGDKILGEDRFVGQLHTQSDDEY